MVADIGWGTIALGPTLVVGVFGGLVAIAAHESDAAFLYHQQHPSAVEATEVDAAVALAREPAPGDKGTRATKVNCAAGARDGGRRNPWTCRVRYASGRRVRYVLKIGPDGAWRGVNARGDRIVSGCCFSVGE
jgi:hypothetical protein